MALPAAKAPRDPLTTVLDKIKNLEKRMERRLKQLEADVQHGQEEAVEKAAKKARCNKPVSFRRKAHHGQFAFNKQMTECIEKASNEMSKRPDNNAVLAKAKAALDQGFGLISVPSETH